MGDHSSDSSYQTVRSRWRERSHDSYSSILVVFQDDSSHHSIRSRRSASAHASYYYFSEILIVSEYFGQEVCYYATDL